MKARPFLKKIKYFIKSKKKKRLNRSKVVDVILFLILALFGLFSIWPLLYVFNNAFKPFDELFRFPPKLFVQNPTTENFSQLFRVLGDSWVPTLRYLGNTILYTVCGTGFNMIFAAMAAYPLAKYKFPGNKFLFNLVVVSLMFAVEVTAITNYVIMSRLGMINTPFAIIFPAISAPLGFYLLKQFMEGVPIEIIESGKIDGAGEYRILFQLVLPQVKPALMTMLIFSFQTIWNQQTGVFIYSEEWKTMSDAIQSIAAGGIARAGVAGAASLLMISVPIVVFIISQSKVVETMSTSGIK